MRHRIMILIAVIVLALSGAAISKAVFTPCLDQCQADYEAQRYACANSGGTWQQVLQCYNDAKAARDLCVAGCQ